MESRLKRIAESLFILMVMSILLLFVFDSVFVKKEPLIDTQFIFMSEWIKEDADDTEQIIEIPRYIDTSEDRNLILKTTLPDKIEENHYISIKSRNDMEVYVEGEEIFTFRAGDIKIPGGLAKKLILFIELEPEYSGKEIKVEFHCNSDITGVDSILFGDTLSIENYYIKRNVKLYVLVIILFVTSMALCVIGFFFLLKTKRTLILTPMAGTVMMCSLWLIFDSELFQVFSGNYGIDGPLAYMSIMVTPYPFIEFVKMLQNRRYRLFHSCLQVISILIFLVFTALHFFGIASFPDTKAIMNFCCMAVCIGSLVTFIPEKKNDRFKEYKYCLWGLLLLAVTFIIEVSRVNFKVNSINGQFAASGFAIMLLLTIYQQFIEMDENRKAKLRAVAETETKTNFFANMSHEIRTPINTITGLNEMILRESRDERIREYASTALNSGNYLADILSDILDFSKLESGSMSIIEKEYNPGNFMTSIGKILDFRAGEKQLKTEFKIDESVPSGLVGDETRIRQIVMNLISNALKYTSQGRISVSFSADDNGMEDGKTMLVCEVRDSGIGIREEDIPNIFTKFARADESGNYESEGSGLGLYIVKKLLDEMKGRIEVESIYGLGSKFIVYIPQTVTDRTPVAKENIKRSRHRIVPQFTAPEAKICVVDDNKVNLAIIEGLLRETKIAVTTALSGKECLEKCRAEKFDLILLDHMMPEMSGIETFKLLREEKGPNQDTEVIMVTANALADFKEECLKQGFADFISKPINGGEFERQIFEHLPSEKLVEIQTQS